MAVSKAYTEDDMTAKTPPLVDHFSGPAGYFKHPLLDKDKDREKPDDIFRPANDDEDILYLGSLGPGVWDKGNRIVMKHKKNELPTQEQVKAALDRAIAKGWTRLYVYQGIPPLVSVNMQMAQYIQNVISSMGLDDQIHVCLDEDETKAWLRGGAHSVAKYQKKQERKAARERHKAGLDDEDEPSYMPDAGREDGPAAPFAEAASEESGESPGGDRAANDDEPPYTPATMPARSATPSVPSVA